MLNTAFVLTLLVILMLSSCGKAKIAIPANKSAGRPGGVSPYPQPIPPTQRPYTINGKTYYPLPSSHGYIQEGVASWYGDEFHGKKTANGETYDMHDLTAAHKTLPMNTYVLVKNLETGDETVVRINDRGPFARDRIIDLTLTAARKLNMVEKGTALVRVSAMGEATSYLEHGKTVKKFLPHRDFQAGEFYIQTGSFTNMDNAEKLRQSLKDQGHKAAISLHNNGEKIFYRVQVEAGNTLAQAEGRERLLNRAGFEDTFVVAR